MEGKAGEWDKWWLELQSWLKQRGYFFLVMALPENVPWYEIPYEAPCVFMGKTNKDIYHAVIGEVGKDGKSWKILHDPLPGSSGIAALESLGFLVPLEPWKKYKGGDDFLDFLTPEEVKALEELSKKQELRPTVVLRQALRRYQAEILGVPEELKKGGLIRNPEYDKATHQLCTAPNCVPDCPLCGDHRSQAANPADLYRELIMAVGNKYPGETRHETALRYIRQAENHEAEATAETKIQP